jgi:hypothetical protein
VTAADLKGGSYNLTVEFVEIVKMRSRFTNKDEYKGVVHFVGAEKGLVLNKTQATAFAEIAGSEEFADWKGLAVVLSPGVARNGKATIMVLKPASDSLT